MNLQQTIYQWLGRALGLEQMQSLADVKVSFAASWAQRAPMLLLFGFVALVAAAAVFYFRHQPNRHHRWRVVLFVIRAAVLCQVLLLLAEPILTLTIHSSKRPALWLLFDGTDSMNIADDLPPDVRAATDKAVGIDDSKVDSSSETKSPGDLNASPTGQRFSRIEYLRALVQKKDQNLLELLGKQFRLQAFLFDSAQSVRSLELRRGLGPIDGNHLAEQLIIQRPGDRHRRGDYRSCPPQPIEQPGRPDRLQRLQQDHRSRPGQSGAAVRREDLYGRRGGHAGRRSGRQDRRRSLRENER